MKDRIRDDNPRWWQDAAGLHYRLEILDLGYKVGLVNNSDGTVICDWPVNPRVKKATKLGKKPSKQATRTSLKSRKKKGKHL